MYRRTLSVTYRASNAHSFSDRLQRTFFLRLFDVVVVAAAADDDDDDDDVLCFVQVVSFDNLEDQELEKREVAEGLFMLAASTLSTFLSFPVW